MQVNIQQADMYPIYTASFICLAPKIAQHYAKNLQEIPTHQLSLCPISPRSVFASISFNFGPNTYSVPHKDFQNLAWGMCYIQSLGDFDSTKDGHLYLKQLEVVVEFPPSTATLFPSAVIVHVNTSVPPHEKRMSMISYSAGGLFRWITYGCCGKKALARNDPQKLRRIEANGAERWKQELGLYPTM